MPYLVLALALLLASCAPSSVPTRGPATGGGALRELPAAGDYVSAVAMPDWVLGGDTGERQCDYGPMVEVLADESSDSEEHYPSPPPLSDAFGPIFDAPLEDGRFVGLERMRGLQVVDLKAAPGAQVASFALPEGFHPLALHPVDAGVVIVATRDFELEYFVQWVALPRGGAPRLVSELRFPGRGRGAYLRRAQDRKPRLVVIEERYAPNCGARTGTSARVIDVDAGTQALAPAFEQGLGPHVHRVRRSGDWLMVEGKAADDPNVPNQVRFFDLDAERAERSLSEPIDIGVSVHGFAAPTDAPGDAKIDLGYWTTKSLPEGVERVDTQHVLRFRLDSKAAPQIVQHCTHALPAARNEGPEGGWFEPPRVSQALFFEEDALLVALETNNVQYARVFHLRLRDCKTREQRLAGRHFMRAVDADRFVALGPHASEHLHAVLYALPALEPRAELRFTLEPVPRALRWRASNGFDFERARFVPKNYFAVPYGAIDADGVLREGDQLFVIERDRLVPGPRLEARLRDLGRSGATRDAHGLRFGVDVPSDGAPSAIPLWTQHIEGELLEPAAPDAQCALARVRWPGPEQRFDARGDALEGLLEFVPADRDPQLGAATAAFPISGFTRLDRVGSLLVATSQDVMDGRRDNRQPCRLEVFDARDLTAVRKTASFVSEELCSANFMLKDQPAFAARDALVFARVVPRYDRPVVHPHGGRVELRALDLRDPYKPVWLPVTRTPEPELALSVWHDGDHPYYAFRLDKIGGSKLEPEAHFYLRRIDLREPRAPRFGERISVPGEPSRIDGHTLYVRQGRWLGQNADQVFESEHRLHTVELRERDVRLIAVSKDEQEGAKLEHQLWRQSLRTLSRCRGRTLYLDYGVLHF